MKNIASAASQEQAVKKEIRIGKTVFSVTTVYKGQQELEQLLLRWAIKKVIASADC